MRRRTKASQSDDEEQVERSASPHYASSEDDEKVSEEPEEQIEENGHDDATNNKEEEKVPNKKKEENAKPEDPSFVPKSGRFFMHDDRAEDVKDVDASKDQKKLWSAEEDEGVWLHDKFNELNVNSEKQKGRRNNYSKNNKFVNKRDNTHKTKLTSQQQYRRKTQPQIQTQTQPQPQTHQTQPNHEQPKSSPRSHESKPIQTQNTSNGSKPHHGQREQQNYQPRGTNYRAKQPHNRNTDYSSASSSYPKEASKRYSSQRESTAPSQSFEAQYEQQMYQSMPQDYPPSVQQYPKQQMRPGKSYIPRTNSDSKSVSSSTASSAPIPEDYNIISSAAVQYNYGYNVPALASQYPQGVYNPYMPNYSYQYPYPYMPSMPSVVPPTDPAIISQGSIQYYSMPYVEDPTTPKKVPVTDSNASSQNTKSQWVPKRSHAIPIKEPPPEIKSSPSKSTQ